MKADAVSIKRFAATLAFAATLMAAGIAGAATNLANVPLANANTTTIHPNIAFVLDDSGSMDSDYMPDSVGSNSSKYCYKWYKYNTLAYNPAQTYNPPIKADGTRFPNSVFTAALRDGYFAQGARQYDGYTTNSLIDLTTLGSVTTTTATIQFDGYRSSTVYYVSNVSVTLLNGSTVYLFNSPTPDASGTNNVDTLGRAVRDSINANTATTGFSASYDSGANTLEIVAPASQAGLTSTPAITRVKVTGTSKGVTISSFSTTTLSTGFYYATHTTDPNSTTCAANSNYTLVTTPSGIAAPNVANGSAEALTNYANWYSYYRRRAFLAKAGIGEAFARLEQDKYRVGLFFINSIESGAGSTNHDLAIDKFSSTHRSNWFDRLYGSRKDGWTPLRGALSRMGRMYAGQISGWDPVQYSCQRNYTILSTDGYWNSNSETTNYGPKKIDGSTNVGDQDGVTGIVAPEKDSSKAQNTLADVAHYYYHTDLRPDTCSSPDVCTNNVPGTGSEEKGDDAAQHQHMTTFTVGFGVSGTLKYQDGYKTATSGDYHDVTQGTKNWPNPVDGSNDDNDRIDDLWHAAVNGHGVYFSARDPVSLTNGLTSALNSIKSVAGSGAAAATSNLQPTTGDNFIYIATYTTVEWSGQLGAYTVALDTGELSATPTWQVTDRLKTMFATSGDSDTRTIYTADGTTRTLFKEGAGGLTATQLAYFDNTKLPQYSDWTTDQKNVATPGLLVNYLRGQDRYEDQSRDAAIYGSYQRLYRDRNTALGDIIHAQPIYVKAPPYKFSDDGYLSFKTANANRAATVYVAANDGMLHAFDADTGDERWAFVPPLVMPDLWRLAGSSYGYGDNHHYYLDGPLTMADARIGSDPEGRAENEWKTVLIGALGKGGRGYYALDVTNPTDPKPLWTFSADDNPNVGYSYGIPMVTKLSDGTWVAVVTSGYNNIPEGGKYATADGIGRVFVLRLSDGSLLKTISTGEGSADNPSGLARINVSASNFSVNNTAIAAYGGDLLGNMWRFDLNAGTVTRIAQFGTSKPIMAAPEIGDVNGKTVIYFGTGQYLGNSDLEDTRTQSIYAIKDDGAAALTDTTKLIRQTLSTSGTVRTATKQDVDWTSADVRGWYIDLPDSGERIALDLQLYAGTLVASSIVPTASECQPGGYSWLYQLDYKTGGYVGNTSVPVATKSTSPYVGVTVSRLPTGLPVIYPISADGSLTKPSILEVQPPNAVGGARRVIWRELFE